MGVTNVDALEVAGVPTMGMNGLPATIGNVWFVDSVIGSSGNTGTTALDPFAALSSAITAATANNGDIIILAANHKETLTTAGAITVNKAGLTIVGLGTGAARPTFTFATSVNATILISSASTSITNVVGVCNINALVTGFDVRAADVTLQYEWHDTSNAIEALRSVLTTSAAARLNVNCVHIGFTNGSSGVNAIRLVGVATANIVVDYYGICTTAVVEMITTACTNVQVTGYFYVSGITNFSRTVVDTQGSSTWYVSGADGAAGLTFDGGSGKALASNDPTTVTANVGAKTDAATYFPGTTSSVMSYVKGSADVQEMSVTSSQTGVMTTGMTLFTIAGGPIQILALMSICQTANNATASTLQYSSSGTLGATTQTISGATATLANATAGTTVIWQGTTLATAPIINPNGAGLAAVGTLVTVPAGTLTATIGVGSTTGTWQHFIRYLPLARGVSVS